MNWTNVFVLSLVGIAGLWAIYQSKTENWNTGQKIGTGVFFFGVIVGLVLDELLGSTLSVLSWAEPIGAVIMLIGLIVSWLSR